jgi:hypothetical protein
MSLTKKDFDPFQNESQVLSWDDFQIENRSDRVSMSGSIDFTKDKEGLAKALEMQKVINSVVSYLQNQDLPEKVFIEAQNWVKNPFN